MTKSEWNNLRKGDIVYFTNDVGFYNCKDVRLIFIEQVPSSNPLWNRNKFSLTKNIINKSNKVLVYTDLIEISNEEWINNLEILSPIKQRLNRIQLLDIED